METKPSERASLYVDGNNWYHFLKLNNVPGLFGLSYEKISRKLVGPRNWLETRYYIGALKQEWSHKLYADQRAFLSLLEKDDPRISVHLGRLEPRTLENPMKVGIQSVIEKHRKDLPKAAFDDLVAMVNAHSQVKTLKEKAVDIMLAKDMLEGAWQNNYDVAYLLSADGDFTPVVDAARSLGKKVFVAAPGYSSELRRVANTFIPLRNEWFQDCHR